MIWIIIEFTALALLAILVFTAQRALRNIPPTHLARGPRRAPVSSDLHRAAEQADRNDMRINTWRWRYWQRHGRWPTDELDRLLADTRRISVLLRRQAA